jgi:hypothetical protein
MTTEELKSSLINKIKSTNDVRFLEMVSLAFENLNYPPVELSDWQLKRIEESEKQYAEGKVISKEDADKKIIEWLKK